MNRAASLDEVAARLRAATLAAWADHPVRFREDANAEEDHGAGWYRDRVVVELAQNAADAADGPGALLLRLSTADRTLLAANTGTPLDGTGLTSLASLRASAKRAGPGAVGPRPTVGRFGVGFAAVRSVSDEIEVVSGTGGVRFSAERTAAELARIPALADEVARRGAALPVLRLPFSDGDAALPDGYDTAVRLVLRDDAAVAEVAAQLADLDDALLLALPGLGTVHVEVDGERRTLADVAERWLVVTAAGEHAPDLLADRPVEEREHRGWQLTWAVPRAGRPDVAGVVHAPTPTDDATTVPALLLGTFPLDPGRRRVAPGPVTDALVAEAGRLWPELLLAARRAAEQGGSAPDPLDLVPTGFPAGALDAALRDAVVEATRHTPVLATASGWVAPADAVVLAPPWDATDAPRVLGGWFDHLAQLAPRHRDLARSLEVAIVGLGELVEQVPATDPARLRELYEVLASAPGDLDELGAAPVPLRDGRVVHGARGVVLVDDLGAQVSQALDALVSWGLRVAHPEAAHPVLERLGAQRVDAGALATHALLRDRVLDGDDHATDVLLTLAAAAPALVPPSWWGEVLLPAADGEPAPARGLVLPGGAAAGWFDPQVLPAVDAEAVERWGADLLERVGVRAGLVVERVDELVADVLEDWPDYLAETGAVDDGELLAVADLDAVTDWPAVLAALAAHPEAVAPVGAEGGGRAPSYVVWRLCDEPAVCPGRPFALPGADRTAGVLAHLAGPPDALAAAMAAAPGGLALAEALGGVADATRLTAEDWLSLLDDLAEGADVPLDWAVDCWRAVVRLALGGTGEELADAAVLPGWDGHAAVAVGAEALAVADPMWRRHPAVLPVLPVPFGATGTEPGATPSDAVADLLDLDLAADRAAGRPAGAGSVRPVPEVLRGLAAGLPDVYRHHERLVVDGQELDWWIADTVLHATDAGLAEGLAAVAGWSHRCRFAAALAGARRDDLLLDLAGEA